MPTVLDDMRSWLLNWYDQNARTLPWRISPHDLATGVRPNPYHVWLSEIMLQQTTIAHGIEYFLKFIDLWPDVTALARARDDDVMAAWAGLGYYARARNLLACARLVAKDLGGRFPEAEDQLRQLPGVGAYTAAAVTAIAFQRPANVVDGNVERVMARLYAVKTPLPTARGELKALAATFVRNERPGDWAQALMDLGAVICRPRAPRCDLCPLQAACQASQAGEARLYPFKVQKDARPVRYGQVLIAHDAQGRVVLEQRPGSGLLGGMMGLPTTEWCSDLPGGKGVLDQTLAAGFTSDSEPEKRGQVVHVFTHFRLELEVWSLRISNKDQRLYPVERQGGLPSVFKKALHLCMFGG